VRISLRAAANVKDHIVRVADVASVEGGDRQLRERIANMDLDEPPRSGQSKSISKKLVEFRLQVAGIDKRLFDVRGSAVTVTLDTTGGTSVGVKELTEEAILDAARHCVLRRLPWEPADIEIRLAQQIAYVARVTSPTGAISLDADLRTAWPPLGRVQVDVEVSVDGRRHSAVPVHLEVGHFDNVVVSKRQIEAKRTITEQDVYLDRREVSALHGYSSSLDSLIGKRAKRSIRPLMVIAAGDVSATDASQAAHDAPILIRRQDRVRLVGQTGALNVSILAEALQDGRTGDLIRLRNVDSKKIIMGRVVSRSEARLPF